MKKSACFGIVSIVLCISGLAIAANDSKPANSAVTTWGDLTRVNTNNQYPPVNTEMSLLQNSVTQVHLNTFNPLAALTPGCRLPYMPSSPDPCDGADDIMASTVLSWAHKPKLPPPAPVNITFDEVPLETNVNGMTIGNASFSCGAGVHVTTVGPGITMFNAPPNIEGLTKEVLTVDFAVPVYGVGYGFCLSSGPARSNATTMTLFDATLTPVAIFSADANNRGFLFVEGRNIANSSIPVKRAVITFSHPGAARFTLDNLTYSLSPEVLLSVSSVSAEQLMQVQNSAEEVIFDDDMESGQQGWKHYLISGSIRGLSISDTWALSSSRSASSTHSWHSGITALYSGDTALESPVIDLGPATTARLAFNHWYHFDDCGQTTFEPDGGIVEIQVLPSSAWVQIFPTSGYPGHIMLDSCGPNPLAGKNAYTRDSGGVFVPAEFDLAPFVGNAVKIRFHVGWDCGNCTREEGWYIDDVTVFGDTFEPNAVYDVYFGTDSLPDVLYARDLNEPQCFVSGLDCNTTYFWKVVARNECGKTEGPIWSFKTLTSTAMLRRVIDEKHQLIDRISQLLEAEAAACEDLDSRLQNGGIRGKEKGNLVQAKEKVHSAMQHEEQSKDAMGKSIDKLWDALRELGIENNSQSP